MSNDDKGFVLAELIIALSILTLLAVTLLPLVTYEAERTERKKETVDYLKVAYVAAQWYVDQGVTAHTLTVADVRYEWRWDGRVVCITAERGEKCFDFE